MAGMVDGGIDAQEAPERLVDGTPRPPVLEPASSDATVLANALRRLLRERDAPEEIVATFSNSSG
jgi:FXSXX-COOH protein